MIHINVKVTRFYAYFVTFIYFLPSKFIFLLSVNMYPEKKHYGTFLPTEIGKIPNQTPISITSADSLTFCALQCLKDVLRCLSVAYNSVTRNCYFYPNFIFASLISSPSTNLSFTPILSIWFSLNSHMQFFLVFIKSRKLVIVSFTCICILSCQCCLLSIFLWYYYQ